MVHSDYTMTTSWNGNTFPRYWPFVRGIHRSPVNSSHKGQWRGALMFSLICVWINGWVNNREAGDLRRHRVHYQIIIIIMASSWCNQPVPCTERTHGHANCMRSIHLKAFINKLGLIKVFHKNGMYFTLMVTLSTSMPPIQLIPLKTPGILSHIHSWFIS